MHSHSAFGRIAAFLAGLFLLAHAASAAGSPGLRLHLADDPLTPFVGEPPRGQNPPAPWPPRYLGPTGKLVTPGYRLMESEGLVVFAYTELAGDVQGLPIVMPLSQFNAALFGRRQNRMLAASVGRKIDPNRRRGGREGLVDIKIPFRVPRGLSAITGSGETRLNITARQRLDLSGLSQYTLGEAQSASANNSRFPTIAFEQESQVNVNGEIGDKITVQLEQNSTSQLDLAESLRLRYDGDEDAIIKVIEAGNTNLTLPGTRLIGFQGGRGGLFGIKAEGTVGGLNMTVVTTQDKGSSNRKTFQGQAEENSLEIPDYRYLENVYFFFDTVHRDAFPDDPAGAEAIDINSVDVYINDFNDINDIEDGAKSGIAYGVWNRDGAPNVSSSNAVPDGVQAGSFHQLERDDYLVDARGYLILTNARVADGYALGVAYRTADGRSFGDVGFIQNPNNPDSRVRLKLLKAKNQKPESITWPLMWRNVYSLGGRNIDPDGFDLRILKEVPGQEPLDNETVSPGRNLPYIQILGLDTHTNGTSTSSPPDNLVDTDNGDNIPGLNLRLGHLVFPFLEPFGEGSSSGQLLEPVPELYNTRNATTRAEKSKYILRTISRSRATRFNLGFEIIENSESVRLNNRNLVRGTDYTIDYTFGQINFIGDAANQVSDPTANLKIDYSSKDPFGGFGQQKSLVGLRLEHPLRDQYSFVGLTLLYSNQTTAAQRVRVGQEPARTLIWDANARLRFKPTLLTSLVDAIPFVNSDPTAISSLDIDLEVAQSLPNPNTKGVAYIDDFEGSQNEVRFSSYKLAWNLSSTPTINGTKLSAASFPKGRLTWYSPADRDRISLLEIQPNREDLTTEQAIVDDFRLRFEPARTNGFPASSADPLGGVGRVSWGGITHYLNGADLSRSKFLEVWVRGQSGKMHVDLGELSERIDLPLDHPTINPHPSQSTTSNRRFRSEDEPLGGLPTGDGVATPAEDVGLDGLTDAQEDSVFRLIHPTISQVPADPSGDNFQDIDLRQDDIDGRYPPGTVGTQGNSPERESIPDSEDLNSNGFLDESNNYFRYSFDLATDRGINPESGQFDGSGPSVRVPGSESSRLPGGAQNPPWRLIRIPLRGTQSPRLAEGTPDTSFNSPVDFLRVWIESDRRVEVQLYEFKAVGNDWQEDPQPSTNRSGDFQVSGIGTDNPIYSPPPGLDLERDPTTGLTLLERSLRVNFEDLYPGEAVTASRTFIQGEDYTKYGTMRLYAHGGNNNEEAPEGSANFPTIADTLAQGKSPVELFIRFTPVSGDTANFYEYRSRVYRGWEVDANTVEIDLELLSQLKGQLLDFQTAGVPSTSDTVLALTDGEIPAAFDKSLNQITAFVGRATYLVRGNPSLNRVKTFTLGIRNRGDDVLLGENELWVDELTVDDIRAVRALSGLLSMRTVLSDLGNLNFDVERRSGDFQDLQGAATGNTSTRIVLSSTLNFDKFLPRSWQTSIPMRFDYSHTSQIPRIRRGSDIVLTPDQQNNESDINSQSRFNLNFRKTAAQENPSLVSRVLFDRVNASLNFVNNSTVSGAITRRRSLSTDALTGSFQYDLNLPQKRSVKPFAWVPLISQLKDAEFFYLPSTVRYSARFARNLRDQQDFSAVAGDTSQVIRTDTESFTLNESYDVKVLPFRSLNGNYQLAVTRDLRNSLGISELQFGRESGRTQTLTVGYTPKLLRWLTVNAQYNANYRENLETGGQKIETGNIRRGLTVNNQNQASLRLGFNLPALFRGLANRGARGEGFSLLGLTGRAISSISNVNASASRNESFTVFGLQGRPSLAYQFGLSDTVQVRTFQTNSLTRTDQSTYTDRADLGTSVRLPLGFTAQASANWAHTERFGNANNEDETITLPDVNLSWRGIERLPVFRWFWSSANLNTSYQKSYTDRGEGGLDDRSLTNDQETSALSPLVSVSTRWKNGISSTVQTSRSRTTDLRYQRNVSENEDGSFPTLDERLIGTTVSRQSDLRANLRYSLSPRIFESLQSSIDLTLEFNMGTNEQTEYIPGGPDEEPSVAPRRNEGRWGGSLGAQYRFSNHFTGGFNFRHERRNDRFRELTNVTFEFRLFGEIEFN